MSQSMKRVALIRKLSKRNSKNTEFEGSLCTIETDEFPSSIHPYPIGTHVFIRDKTYAWLPAVTLEDSTKFFESSSNSDKPVKYTIRVKLSLPNDWDDVTVMEEDEAEDVLPDLERTVSLPDYPGWRLPRQNIDEETGEQLGKSDLADLMYLHEAAMLYNLKDRNGMGIPYTRVGDIIIATNPFTWIDGLYTPKCQHFYAERLIWNVEHATATPEEKEDGEEGPGKSTPSAKNSIYWFTKLNHDPHVYETSCLSYRGLALESCDQAILVTGESGAGKTETVKIVLKHLATLPQTRPSSSGEEKDSYDMVHENEIVSGVIQSNPVFEAFGNAMTLRNDNSSRFGKFIQLEYDVEDAVVASKHNRNMPFTHLVGSRVETYLLEKSRVVGHDRGERGYHIFYQLLSYPGRAQFWEELENKDVTSFSYLGDSVEVRIDGMNDAEIWSKTLTAMEFFSIKDDVLHQLMRALCIVLQLGNITFDPDPATDDDGCKVSSPNELSLLMDIFGIEDEALLQETLTQRTVRTSRDEVKVSLNAGAAKDGCDALAKEIYARIFHWMVHTINASTRASSDKIKGYHRRNVGLLDIFGFEVFLENRFEQFCINYANERLQQKYVTDVFRKIRTEYESEGIEVFDFSIVDNSNVCNVIESRTGLIAILDEECARPKGNDASYVYKIKAVYREEPILIREKLHTPYQFGVKHFAGPVTYNTKSFVEKNTDSLPMDLIDIAIQSKNTIVSSEFTAMKNEVLNPKDAASSRGRRSKKTTVVSKFKRQLQSLIKSMENSRTRYIRCIKPNAAFRPGVTDHRMTITQLGSAGLVTAVTIGRETFPNTLHYDVVLERFRCIAPDFFTGVKSSAASTNIAVVKDFLTMIFEKKKTVIGDHEVFPFACGKSKLFLRSGALETLEEIRMGIYNESVVIIQHFIRGVIYPRMYQRKKRCAIKIQAWWRGTSYRYHLKRYKRYIVLVQCAVRAFLARVKLKRIRWTKAAIVIHTKWRTKLPIQKLKQYMQAAKVLKRAIRNRKNNVSMNAAMFTIVQQAQLDHKLKELKINLAMTDKKGRHMDPEKLLKDSQKVLETLSEEVYQLRSQASGLNTAYSIQKEKLKETQMHSYNVEAALKAKKLESRQRVAKIRRLEEDRASYKQENQHLKKTIKDMHNAQRMIVSKQQDMFKTMRTKHLNEVRKLRGEFAKAQQNYASSLRKMELELQMEKEAHKADVEGLEEELQTTLSSHNEDLSRMFEALEATQRDNETLRVVDDFLVSSSQEKEIVELKKEIEMLKSNHAVETSFMEKEIERLQAEK